jgi:SPASM domain peptide maturase of grasp-with-spasm system
VSARRVFRLFACCVPVRGARRSTLCDLQRERYELIPNGLFDILARYTDHTLDEIRADFPAALHATLDEYFDHMVREEYGFWCDDPESFPPLSMQWERPELVTNAIVDVDDGSRHDWPSLLGQLDALGCEAIQVRFFRPAPVAELDEVLGAMAHGRLRSVELLLPHDPAWGERTLEELCVRHQRVMGLLVHTAPEERMERVPGLETVILYRTERIDSHAHCGRARRRGGRPRVPRAVGDHQGPGGDVPRLRVPLRVHRLQGPPPRPGRPPLQACPLQLRPVHGALELTRAGLPPGMRRCLPSANE